MSGLPNGLRATSAIVALSALLTACVQAPLGPTVQALPGPRKSFSEFQQDNSLCMGMAQTSIGDAQRQLDQQQGAAAIGGMLLGAAVGAAFGGGRGAALGAGTGLAAGSAAGVDNASYNAMTLQQRYDNSFAQCMYAKGNQVPGVAPVVADYAPVRSSGADPMVRSVQAELVRTGYLSGGVDGNYGPMTRTAILEFERANGMAADASPSGSLLARLRSAPGGSGNAVAANSLVMPVTGGAKGGAGAALVQPVSASAPGAPGAPSSGLVSPVTSSAGAGLVPPVTGAGSTTVKGQ